MSVFVSIGQGGNQLAASFWQRAETQRYNKTQSTHSRNPSATGSNAAAASSSAAAASASSAAPAAPSPVPPVPMSPFFALDGMARGLFVDAEPKVIMKLRTIGREMATTSSSVDGMSGTRQRRSGARSSTSTSSSASTSASSTTLFSPRNLLFEQYGRGNNFAMGYFGRLGDEGMSSDGRSSLLEKTMECLRIEAERCEQGMQSIVTMHAIAGGTGSGLGARITEEIRDNYQNQFILSCAIAPFSTGDTPLQHYNSLLCLSHIYPAADGVIVASNQDISRGLSTMMLQKHQATFSGGPLSFAGINTYLSACLADILAPTRYALTPRQLEQQMRERARMVRGGSEQQAVTMTSATNSSVQSTPSLYELISHAAPIPSYKLLEIWSSAGLGSPSLASRASFNDPRMPPIPTWKSCMDMLKRWVPQDEPADESTSSHDADARATASFNTTFSYSLFARGDSPSDPIASFYDQLSTRCSKLFPSLDWNPYPMDLISTTIPRLSMDRAGTPSSSMGESTRSLSVCVNRTRTALALRPVVRKARAMLDEKAYVHWYTRYGLEASEIADAIDSIDSIITDYQHV